MRVLNDPGGRQFITEPASAATPVSAAAMAAQHSLQQQGVLGQFHLDPAAAGLGLDELTQSLMQQSGSGGGGGDDGSGGIFDESSTMLQQLASASGPDAAATAALALALSGAAGEAGRSL
jgi:hypothetical protein